MSCLAVLLATALVILVSKSTFAFQGVSSSDTQAKNSLSIDLSFCRIRGTLDPRERKGAMKRPSGR